MTCQSLYLVDQTPKKVACLSVRLNGERYSGTISLDVMPAQLRKVFEEFEQYVESQVFSLADEMEEKIAAMAFKVILDDGMEMDVEDLQVYPNTGRVSFKTRQSAIATKSA